MLQSCDTMVSLPSASANGQTIFAKNSDRPPGEAQPLQMTPRLARAPGAVKRLQFVSLREAPVAYRHVGSRPYWCRGYEHGFNEHQVVIGNEALPSRLPAASEPKLVGMELLRLGLERAATAREAVDVMTALVERHGQGEFANEQAVRTYDNIFLIADPREAFVLEAVGHDWAVRTVENAVSISNVGQAGRDAQRVSRDASATAATLGLYDPASDGSFDFAGAFADRAASASGVARQRRSAALLRQRVGEIDVRAMISILSDHSDGASPSEPFVAAPHRGVSICVHRDSGERPGNTAASLVADLCADGARLPVYWCSLYSPCLSLFYPVFIEGKLPVVLSVGGEQPSGDSPWWLFHDLTHDAVSGGQERIEEVRSGWRELQGELFDTAYEAAARGRRMIDRGRADEAAAMLTAYMEGAVNRMLAAARRMLNRQPARRP